MWPFLQARLSLLTRACHLADSPTFLSKSRIYASAFALAETIAATAIEALIEPFD